MANKRIEGKLKAVIDFKKQFYIGTREALSYINELILLYDNPKIVSDAVEKGLKKNKSLEEITYPITPDKVAGISGAIGPFGKDLYFLDQDPESYIHDSEENHAIQKIFNRFYVFDTYHGEESTLKENTRAFYNIFLQANKKKVVENDEFMELFAYHLIDKYTLTVQKINDPVKRNKFISRSEDILTNLQNIDLNNYFSKENIDQLKDDRKEASSLLGFDIHSMIKKIFRDQVDHRLENRRIILTAWLNQHKIKNYNEALLKINKLTKFQNDILNFIPNDLEGGHESQEITMGLEYIRPLIFSEERFIEKYLRS